VRCHQLTGATTTLARGTSSGETVVGDVGAHFETGYRFGVRERWDVGLRALVHALGTNAAGIGGAQLFLGWSYP
jgi:hypothetical protein